MVTEISSVFIIESTIVIPGYSSATAIAIALDKDEAEAAIEELQQLNTDDLQSREAWVRDYSEWLQENRKPSNEEHSAKIAELRELYPNAETAERRRYSYRKLELWKPRTNTGEEK